MEKKMSVREYLTTHINDSKKTQKQIAKEAGFDTPNIISMLKSGDMDLPVARAPGLARALGLDEAELMLMVIREQNDAMYQALLPYVCVNSHERALLKVIRNREQGLLGTAV